MDKVTFSQLKKSQGNREQKDSKTSERQNIKTSKQQDGRTSEQQNGKTSQQQNVRMAEHQNSTQIGHQPKSRFLRKDGTLLKKTTVYLPPDLLKEARNISFDESISISDIVQQGMKLFIQNYKNSED